METWGGEGIRAEDDSSKAETNFDKGMLLLADLAVFTFGFLLTGALRGGVGGTACNGSVRAAPLAETPSLLVAKDSSLADAPNFGILGSFAVALVEVTGLDGSLLGVS